MIDFIDYHLVIMRLPKLPKRWSREKRKIYRAKKMKTIYAVTLCPSTEK